MSVDNLLLGGGMMQDDNGDRVSEPEVINGAAGTEGKGVVLARDVFPEVIPIVPLHNRPLFPKMLVPLMFEAENLKRMIRDRAEAHKRYVGLLLVKTSDDERTTEAVSSADLHKVGVVAEIVQTVQIAPEAPVQVMLSVLERFRVESFTREEPHIEARVDYLLETDMGGNEELRAYSVAVIKSIKDLVQMNPLHKEELSIFMSRSNLHEPGRLADFAAALTTADGQELQEVLETVSIRSRLRRVLVLLKREIDISKLQAKISRQIEEKVSKNQKEFFLREQLKAIKKELGIEKEGREAELERFEKRLEGLKLTKEAEERVKEEMDKLKLIEPASPEFNVSRTYVDWLTILPWGVFTKDSYDIAKARRKLDKDHYGLDDVKDRILEFLSVGIMKGNISGSILCFVGPPGVGKTSIGHSIAEAMGRNFYRFSVGGIRDEAEIKGHRRTYIGALPGKFIQAMKVCKSANPVIMLDEIDKIGASYQGDPASALLEVLDPEQNRDFLDHYLDVRFDLSNVFFICTANQLDTIPRPLLDRMEVIKLSGYILKEKLGIAKKFLLPKQLREHGVEKGRISISLPAVREIIDGYSREPGVRGLENNLKKIIRKSVKEMVETGRNKVSVGTPDVVKYLGRRVFTDESSFKLKEPGVVMGLAWTSLGGDVIFIESSAVATGKSGFKQTGQLGSVMVESSEIAYSFVRGFTSADTGCRDFFETHAIHLHVPAGATPKDGPSAGITMATCLYSLAKKKPVRRKLAMTGELSLTGKVMPIGGVKEKTIAARRNNVHELIFPDENRKDFEELPAHVKAGMKPHFVKTFKEVVDLCF